MIFDESEADRSGNNYAAARLQGLEKDLKLKGDDYQLGKYFILDGFVLTIWRCFRPFRLIHSWSSSFEFVVESSWSTKFVHWWLHDCKILFNELKTSANDPRLGDSSHFSQVKSKLPTKLLLVDSSWV